MRQQLRFATSEQRKWIGLLARSMRARSIRGSNSIEGYNVTEDDALAAVEGESPLTAGGETWEAILGYQRAMTYVLQTAGDLFFGEFYSFFNLSPLHYMIMSYDLDKRPGMWRIGPIYVRQESTGAVVYEGPDAKEVPKLVNELTIQLNQPDKTIPVIIRAAMAHLNFVMIHPFRDGNGRMARCLQTMVLAREGILERQFCSIEEWLGRNTQEYYRVLAEVGEGSWNPDRDARPWIRFCLKAHFQQAATLERRTKEYGRLWGELEEQVRRAGLPERTISALFDAALGYKVRNSIYRKQAEVSPNVAGTDLTRLASDGFLKPIGVARGRMYEATPRLKELRLKSREVSRPITDPFLDSNELSQLSLRLSSVGER